MILYDFILLYQSAPEILWKKVTRLSPFLPSMCDISDPNLECAMAEKPGSSVSRLGEAMDEFPVNFPQGLRPKKNAEKIDVLLASVEIVSIIAL